MTRYRIFDVSGIRWRISINNMRIEINVTFRFPPQINLDATNMYFRNRPSPTYTLTFLVAVINLTEQIEHRFPMVGSLFLVGFPLRARQDKQCYLVLVVWSLRYKSLRHPTVPTTNISLASFHPHFRHFHLSHANTGCIRFTLLKNRQEPEIFMWFDLIHETNFRTSVLQN
jgi:hypothetical protein